MYFNKEIIFGLAFFLCVGGKVVLAAAVDQRSTESTLNQFCSLVQNGELLANPSNCNYYYQCNNGVAYTLQCASGYYFSKDSQMCLPQNQVNCIANNNNVCLGQVAGSLISYNGNCNAYYICTTNGPQIGYCPTNYNFNPIQQQCQTASIYPCTNSNTNTGDSLTDLNPCDYMQNGVPFKDPLYCQNWYICQNNVLARGVCPTNYGFDSTSATCLYNTTCIANNNSNGDSLSPAPIGTQCTQVGQTAAVSNSCTYYYKCNGNQYILNQCPNNLYYDTVSGSCVNQLNARNNCDRCVGNNLEFVNTYSTTDCTNYTYCVNGVANYTGTCPSGAYFNQVAGACQTNVPEPAFGCCNPNAYSITAM